MSNLPIEIPEYLHFKRDVELVNDVFVGTKRATKHLDQFEREETPDFEKRQKNATIDNYVFRTADSIKNIIFRKPIDLSNVTNKELLKWLEEDIDNKGNSIDKFAKKLCINAARDGFTYILVDSPIIREDEIVTKRDEKLYGIKPYFVNILRNDLFYFETDSLGKYKVIVFNESYKVKSGLFGLETKVQQKAIFNDGRVMVFRDNAIVEDFTREVKEITLVKVCDSDIPPLLDMAKLNIQQMNRKSEKANYVRLGACPFPLVYGQLSNDGVKTLSISRGLQFNNKQESGFEWAEMSGRNHAIIKEEIESLNLEMENISVSFATELNVKTATQVEKDSLESESKLTDYASSIEEGINKAIEFMGLYRNNFDTSNQFVNVNRDFSSNILSAEQFSILQQLRMNGDLSYDMLIDLLVKGEILNYMDEKQRETEKQRLLDEGLQGREIE